MWNCADAETSVHVCFPWADMAENDAMQFAKGIEDHCRNNLVNHQSLTFAPLFFSPSRVIFKPRLDFQLQGKRFYKFWLNCNDVTLTHHTPKRSKKYFRKWNPLQMALFGWGFEREIIHQTKCWTVWIWKDSRPNSHLVFLYDVLMVFWWILMAAAQRCRPFRAWAAWADPSL